MKVIPTLTVILLCLFSGSDSVGKSKNFFNALEYNPELNFSQRRHRHKHGESGHSFFHANHKKEFLKSSSLISEVSWSKDKDLDIHWPVKKEAVVEGDLILGGLMMVHEREDSVTCGPVMPQGGVQALETMLYTLDVINNRTLLPSIRLGAHILDDCDKDTYGLEMAVDFIKGTSQPFVFAPANKAINLNEFLNKNSSNIISMANINQIWPRVTFSKLPKDMKTNSKAIPVEAVALKSVSMIGFPQKGPILKGDV